MKAKFVKKSETQKNQFKQKLKENNKKVIMDKLGSKNSEERTYEEYIYHCQKIYQNQDQKSDFHHEALYIVDVEFKRQYITADKFEVKGLKEMYNKAKSKKEEIVITVLDPQ